MLGGVGGRPLTLDITGSQVQMQSVAQPLDPHTGGAAVENNATFCSSLYVADKRATSSDSISHETLQRMGFDHSACVAHFPFF